MNKPNDELLHYLDNILEGLRNGGSEYNLTRLEGEEYQDKLEDLHESWQDLKQCIYSHRENITDTKELYSKSEDYFQLAYVDAHTGLPNKRMCDEKLRAGGVLHPGDNICCIMFDLNNLKYVNDNFGHKQGDILISSFAHLIRKCAPDKMFVGRYGGDEFIGILENTTPSEIDLFLTELLYETSQYKLNAGVYKIEYAQGTAFSENYMGYTLQLLLDEADKKMYQDKEQKKRPDYCK